MTERDGDRGGGKPADETAAPTADDLDEKVAEMTALERKLAEINVLEKKIAELKELEYELVEQRSQEEAAKESDVGARDVEKPARSHPPRRQPTEPDENEDDKDTGLILREYRRVMYQFSFIGIEFGVAVALGFFGGRWLDNRWDTAPWMMLLGVALGLTAAGRDLYRLVKRAQKKSDEGVAAKVGEDLVSSREVEEDLVSSREPKNRHSS